MFVLQSSNTLMFHNITKSTIMVQTILKQDIIDIILKDALLFGKVAYLLGVTPRSLPRILASNSLKLTQASVLKSIGEHLGIKDHTDLLTEVSEVSEA